MTATIYQCSLRGINPVTPACHVMNHGKRAKCPGCGSAVRAVVGHAIAVVHRGDGRYTIDQAVREFASLKAADTFVSRAYAADNTSALVARFVI